MISNLSADIAWFSPVSFCDFVICRRSDQQSGSLSLKLFFSYHIAICHYKQGLYPKLVSLLDRRDTAAADQSDVPGCPCSTH